MIAFLCGAAVGVFLAILKYDKNFRDKLVKSFNDFKTKQQEIGRRQRAEKLAAEAKAKEEARRV